RPAHPRVIHPAAVPGRVRFDDVSFDYPGADRSALTGIDLDVPAGTTLALVGETGSGKTTLASLVARLYDPGQGRILIDGTDIRDLKLAALAARAGGHEHRAKREPARRLRHHGGLPRVPLLRRGEAAHRHRPDPAARPARA